MEDVDFFSEDFIEFEKYIIGFTENQYSKPKEQSTSPVDQPSRHPSLSRNYAERSNKAAENMFQDLSNILDRQKTKYVSKINVNRLDLVFELTERRKNSNQSQRTMNSDSFSRNDSRMSACSVECDTMAPVLPSTFPAILVQQLPPLSQPTNTLLCLPDIHIKPASVVKKPKKKKETIKGNNLDRNPESFISKIPKLVHISNDGRRKLSQKNREINDDRVKPDNVKKTERVPDSEHCEDPSQDQIQKNNNKGAKFVKWQNLTDKIIDSIKDTKDPLLDKLVYRRQRSMSKSLEGHLLRSSFCQSSYQERADKQRAFNIRKRHSLQTKTGPLDFNKLRRQIEFSRSRTMLW